MRLINMLIFAGVLFAIGPGVEIRQGIAPHYDPPVINRTMEIRGIETTLCPVSSPLYGLMTELWVYSPRYKTRTKALVVDQSHPRHLQWHLDTRRYIEFGWKCAQGMCDLKTPGSELPSACPIIVHEVQKERRDDGIK